MPKPQTPPQWSPDDQALAFTCYIAESLLSRGSLPESLEFTGAPFRPKISDDERFIVHGQYERRVFTVVGDGSYTQISGGGGGTYLSTSLRGTIVGGIAMTASNLAVTSLLNNRSRKKAENNLEPRWIHQDNGQLYISTHGFYPCSNGASPAWHWGAINQMSVVGRSQIEMVGDAEGDQQVRWYFRSPLAELVFVLWASAVNPNHPSLKAGRWLPPGWLNWAVGSGRLRPQQAEAIAWHQDLR